MESKVIALERMRVIKEDVARNLAALSIVHTDEQGEPLAEVIPLFPHEGPKEAA